jgi:hypothetical protein
MSLLYGAEVTLSTGNLYECVRCKGCVPARQVTWLVRPPQVLTILLKRFVSTVEKVDTLVRFPVRGLRLDPWVRSGGGGGASPAPAGEHVYDLFAVVNHSGSLTAGHYTAVVQHPLSGVWYAYNDDSVRAITRQPERPALLPAAAMAHKLRAALAAADAAAESSQARLHDAAGGAAAQPVPTPAGLIPADDDEALAALLVSPEAYCLFYQRRG